MLVIQTSELFHSHWITLMIYVKFIFTYHNTRHSVNRFGYIIYRQNWLNQSPVPRHTIVNILPIFQYFKLPTLQRHYLSTTAQYTYWWMKLLHSANMINCVVVVTLFSSIIHEQNTSNTNLTNKAYPGFCKRVLCWRPPEKALSYQSGGLWMFFPVLFCSQNSLTVLNLMFTIIRS